MIIINRRCKNLNFEKFIINFKSDASEEVETSSVTPKKLKLEKTKHTSRRTSTPAANQPHLSKLASSNVCST